MRSRRYVSLVAIGVLIATTSSCRRSLFGNGQPPASEQEPSNAPPMVEERNPRETLGPLLLPGDVGNVELVLDIRTDQNVKPISPLIYGINSDGKGVVDLRLGVIRSGGNRLTAYNWENNASNAGADYLYQNDALMSASDAPAKPILEVIDGAVPMSAATVVTLSIADYVAADKNGGGDVRNSGPNYLATRFKHNFAKKPGPFSALPNTLDSAVYQDEFVAFLKAQRPHSKIIFSLDNEPDLWAHTHAEIFPKPLTYADLWRRNHDFAKAAKEAWPQAEVLGFVSYGYLGFVSLQNAPDANGRNFIEWYLDQAKAAEQEAGFRLIDYLDLHWYPEAQGGGKRIVSEETAPEVVSAREQAPRSLWDSNYEETSWIRDAAGGPIKLLPRVKAKIDAHYPGTKLSFTEWNFGGGNHISGTIAVADVLGIFGRYGVSLATYWAMSAQEPFAWAAFRAYRNYDGQGSAFGDTSVSASASNVSAASVYASIDRADPRRVVIIALNKGMQKKTGIKLTHSVSYAKADVYVLAGTSTAISKGAPLHAIATNAFIYDMPAQSVSVIVPQL